MMSVKDGVTLKAGTAASPAERSKRGWSVTFSAMVGLIFGPSAILIFLFGVFVAPLAKEFGWSRPAILTAITIVSLSSMVASPIQGFLVDRYGARRLALFSYLPFAAGLAALSQIGNSLTEFYVIYGLLPFLSIGLWPVSYLRVVGGWFDRRLGMAIGIANGGIGLGAAILPLLATYLMDVDGWRAAYLGLAAIIAFVIFPLNIWLLREVRPHAAGMQAPRGSATHAGGGESAFAAVARGGSYWLLIIAFFLLGLVNTGLATTQVSLLIDAGATPKYAALVASVFGAAVLVIRFLTGALLDYVSARRLMSTICIGSAIACLMYAAAMTNWLAFAAAILVGGIFGAEFDVLSYMVKRYFGLAAFGRVYGTVFAVFQLGGALGATMLAVSRRDHGSYAPGLYVYAGILFICSTLFLLLSPNLMRHDVVQDAHPAA